MKPSRCLAVAYLVGSPLACGDAKEDSGTDTSATLAAYDQANERLAAASCDCKVAAGSTPSLDQCLHEWRVIGSNACERRVLNEANTADWLECYTGETLERAECLEDSCAADCYLIALDCPWTSDIADALGACK